jgi:hypothetical protein
MGCVSGWFDVLAKWLTKPRVRGLYATTFDHNLGCVAWYFQAGGSIAG